MLYIVSSANNPYGRQLSWTASVGIREEKGRMAEKEKTSAEAEENFCKQS